MGLFDRKKKHKGVTPIVTTTGKMANAPLLTQDVSNVERLQRDIKHGQYQTSDQIDQEIASLQKGLDECNHIIDNVQEQYDDSLVPDITSDMALFQKICTSTPPAKGVAHTKFTFENGVRYVTSASLQKGMRNASSNAEERAKIEKIDAEFNSVFSPENIEIRDSRDSLEQQIGMLKEHKESIVNKPKVSARRTNAAPVSHRTANNATARTVAKPATTNLDMITKGNKDNLALANKTFAQKPTH